VVTLQLCCQVLAWLGEAWVFALEWLLQPRPGLDFWVLVVQCQAALVLGCRLLAALLVQAQLDFALAVYSCSGVAVCSASTAAQAL
jgi:hypothetical protein